MEGRREIVDNNELEVVTGGALRWRGGKVYCLDDPTHVYTFDSYEECTDYIKNYWPGGTQNEDTLIWLEKAGYVHRAY